MRSDTRENSGSFHVSGFLCPQPVSGETTVSMATQLIVKLLRLWVPWQHNISHYIENLLVSAVCCWGPVLGPAPPI